MADYAIHDTTLVGIADTIRKKDGTSALIDPADYAERINLMGMLETKTASKASSCDFSDGADDVPIVSGVFYIEYDGSGHTGMTITRTDGQTPPVESDTYTVDWSGRATVYGGTYNSATGVLTLTQAIDGSTLPIPVEIQLSPVEIRTLLGDNSIFCNTGDSEIQYRSSGTITPTPIQPTLISKNITQNGLYDAQDDNADGYSQVFVAVSGGSAFSPTFSETRIADNTAHANSFTLNESYSNYDMVKIVWWESASSSGFLYTTPDILDEIFTVGSGKICINKPSTNYYVCYTASGLTWTQTNQRNIYVHEIYGVTFTNCTMQATDLYKRGAITVTKYAITSQTSLKDYDMFVMSSIHATDGSETMPTTWLYQYPQENISDAFSCPTPCVLQEYNANDEAFVISEHGMTAARYFMVQGIKFTTT